MGKLKLHTSVGDVYLTCLPVLAFNIYKQPNFKNKTCIMSLFTTSNLENGNESIYEYCKN